MLICGDSEQLAVSTASVGFTSTKLKPTSGNFTGQKCQRVLFQAHDDACYVNFDGTAATSTKGVEMTALDILVEEGFANISNLRFIRKTGNMVIRAWFWYNV